MKVRTVYDLQDLIDADLGWRKKELDALKSNIHSARSFAKDTALRSGVALLYAHWEGFIKNAATYYLCFISGQKHKYSELKPNFIAITIRNDLVLFTQTKKATLHTEIINRVFTIQQEKSQIPFENIIKTASNLNSSVFQEIMATIGLDDNGYELYFKLIDEQLLKMRNCIAHGDRLEELDLDEVKYKSLHEKIIILLNTFASQVLNAAILKEYLV